MEAWTDERLDDLAATLRPLPAELARNTEAIERLTDEVRSIRTDVSSLQRQIAQIGWGLSFAFVGTMIALIVAAV